MQRLGYSDNPILIYEHHDTNNNHIHIVSSRVGMNGKKIKDNFEGKRANQYLNAILNREPKQEFNRHLSTSLTYQFGTYAQFMLLMELNGYRAKKQNDHILFFKHGEKQGSISLKDLDLKISSQEKYPKNYRQAKAIIYKYRNLYSGKLRCNHENKFTTEEKKFESDLTNFLKQKFGFDFVFFSGKGKEIPYGYVLIDHKKREMYKGSDLLKLDFLITNVVNAEKESVYTTNGNVYTKFIRRESEKFQEAVDYKKEIQPIDILSDFLDEVERANYQGNGKARLKRFRSRKRI